MHIARLAVACAILAVAWLVCLVALRPAVTFEHDDPRIISDATGGQFKAARGSYLDRSCGRPVGYEAEVVDLNRDGQPEVFTRTSGNCAGQRVDLIVKNAAGQWRPQFGLPGDYKLLEARNQGYPDIGIESPGSCLLVWRWNGEQYVPYKKCG